MTEQKYKFGNEFLPFHRQASHVNPDYRDGWNACFAAALSHPVVQPRLTDAGHLSGDTLQAHRQCLAVAHMARALAEVHDARAMILEHDPMLTEVIGSSTADIMEDLGDTLSNMDAVDDSDDWINPVFEAAQKRWPIAAKQPATTGQAGPNLTADEWGEVLASLIVAHDPEDFEAECPGCTAYQKIDEYLKVSPPIAQGGAE
jgi:hypothetical protein